MGDLPVMRNTKIFQYDLILIGDLLTAKKTKKN